MTMRATTVADYIVQRLAEEGITHCFGVPGDYAFPVCGAVNLGLDACPLWQRHTGFHGIRRRRS
jgi:glyoxylate carboligase